MEGHFLSCHSNSLSPLFSFMITPMRGDSKRSDRDGSGTRCRRRHTFFTFPGALTLKQIVSPTSAGPEPHRWWLKASRCALWGARRANLISIPLMHLLLSAHLVMDGEDMSREMCGDETDVCVYLRVEKKMFILKMLPLWADWIFHNRYSGQKYRFSYVIGNDLCWKSSKLKGEAVVQLPQVWVRVHFRLRKIWPTNKMRRFFKKAKKQKNASANLTEFLTGLLPLLGASSAPFR